MIDIKWPCIGVPLIKIIINLLTLDLNMYNSSIDTTVPKM